MFYYSQVVLRGGYGSGWASYKSTRVISTGPRGVREVDDRRREGFFLVCVVAGCGIYWDDGVVLH